MKAMLYADWRSVRRSVKAILWVVLVMSVAASAFGGVMVVPFMLTMLSLMFPATLMNTDHAYGWDKLSLTLPVSRRDVVGSKFTVSLLVNLAAFALSTVLILIFTAVNRDSSLAENLLSLIACEAAGLLLMGVQFVLILKFGTERGRYLLMGVVWVPIILINVLKNHPAANSLVKAVGGMDSWPVTRLAGFAAGMLLLCAAAFAIHIQIIDYYSPKGDGIKISCVQFLFAGVLGLICMAIFETPDLGNILACWLPILYAGVLSCGIGYTLQVVAQADADPTAASLILSLESAFAAISGALVLHESMTLRQLLGCAVIFCAVILSNLPEKQAKLPNEPK